MLKPIFQSNFLLYLPVAILSVVLWVATNVGISSLLATDWPQWNGSLQNGRYEETGVLTKIPEEGLRKRWTAKVGLGYSGPSVANGRVFVTDFLQIEGEKTNNPGTRDKIKGSERIHAFDLKTGELLWTHAYEREYLISYPAGPRVTPTVDGDSIFALGAEGDLVSLDVVSGAVRWSRQLRDEYKTETPIWGYSGAPLIYRDWLITLAGGKGSLVVALDKATGKEIWRSLSGENIGYCPPTLVSIAGKDQVVIWEPKALHGLTPETGAELWTVPLEPKYEMSIAPPVVSDDKMFVSGIGEVAAMFSIDRKSAQSPLRQLWKGKAKHAIYCANSTPVFDEGYLYGADCGSGALICVRAEDGERMWETYKPTCGGDRRMSHGTAFLTKVGDLYYILSETGDFIIAKLSPEKYEEISRFKVLEATNECFGRAVVWSYPAYADRCLFARNDKELVAYEIGQ